MYNPNICDNVIVSELVTVTVCNSQHCYRLDLSQDEETEPILEMTSLLNPLDKLKAADNNSTEPDPTNIVDEDNVLFSKYIDPLEGK